MRCQQLSADFETFCSKKARQELNCAGKRVNAGREMGAFQVELNFAQFVPSVSQSNLCPLGMLGTREIPLIQLPLSPSMLLF